MKKQIHRIRKHQKEPLSLHHVQWDKVEKIFSQEKKTLLQSLEDDTKHFPYTKDILKLLAAGMFLGLSIAFPTLPMALAPFIIESRKFQKHRLHQTIKRLQKQKLVEIVEKDGQTVVQITAEGRMHALQYKLDDIFIEKPKKWDKKWRVVIFDIPEKYKRIRDIFRRKLKGMGFYLLQESVWVYPFPCFDQVEFLRQIYHVDVSVRYIIAEKIEDENDLIRHFGLG